MLLFDLIRVSDGGTTFEALASSDEGLTALESYLLQVREAAQTAVNGPLAASFILSNASTTLQRFESYYAPLGDQAIREGVSAVDVPAELGPVETDPTDPRPSIWDPRIQNWDFIAGASFLMQLLEDGAVVNTGQTEGVKHYLNLRPADLENPPIRECVYCFPASAADEVEGIVLFFTNTRTKVISIGSSGPLPLVNSSDPAFPDEPSAWTVRWRPNPDLVSPICIAIRYQGDPPHVRTWTWLVDGCEDTPIPKPVCRPGSSVPAPPDRVHWSQDRDLGAYLMSSDQEFQLRTKLVKGATEFKKDKEFFLEMERVTHDHAPDPQDFSALSGYLANRYFRRSEAEHFGKHLPVFKEDLQSWRPQAVAAGELLTLLMVKHFPAKGGGIDFEALAGVFERFGGGELTIFATHGSPNGMNIFCFAELAELLVQMGHERETWRPLFEIFVRMCRIYVTSYHLCGIDKRTFCSYRVDHNPTGERAPSESWKQALRSDVGPKQTRHYYNDLVQSALYDEFPWSSKPPQLSLVDTGCPKT
jgi:hypothetical protein